MGQDSEGSPAAPGSTQPRASLLAPFGVRSYRFMFPADLLTSWAFEMETLILNWYVLVETGSVLLLTLYGSLMFTGTLLAPLYGVVGDRIGHRSLLCLMRGTYAFLALLLTVFAATGVLNPLIVFLVGAVMGLVRPSDIAVRNTLIGGMMPGAVLMSAIAVSRTAMDGARIAGALAGAALFALLGLAAAYVMVTAFYLASLALTAGIARNAAARAPAGRASPLRELREGFGYVWTTERVLAAMVLAFLVNFCAYPLTGGLLAHVARDVYGMDQTGLGILSACFAVGALLGSIVLGQLAPRAPAARVMMTAGFVWYGLLLAYGLVPSPLVGGPLLLAAGFAQSLCMVPMAVMLLRTAGERFRGRVMGVRMLAVYGMPLGLLLSGVLVDTAGFAVTATLFCAFGLAVCGWIAWRWRDAIWPATAPANRA